MKVVVQKDEFGCGVASVGSVLGISYVKSLKFFGSNVKKKADELGFYCKDMVEALRLGGLFYEYKYIKPRLRNKIYKNGVIVFIKRSKRYPEGHYLVRKNRQWLDSWINFPEKKRKAGIRKILPGKPIYYLYPCGDGRV